MTEVRRERGLQPDNASLIQADVKSDEEEDGSSATGFLKKLLIPGLTVLFSLSLLSSQSKKMIHTISG